MNAHQVAHALLNIQAVGFSIENPVRFKSGILSPIYIDNRRLPFYPTEWRIVVDAFHEIIHKNQPQFDVIAGVAMGGVPHGAALAYSLGVPFVFVRKEAKEHGKRQLIEGGTVNRARVLVIEDLITTGSSSLAAVSELREAGALVQDVIAIVDYKFDEALKAFDHASLRLYTATDFPTILEAALEQNRFTDVDAGQIREWLADPHKWANNRGLA